MLYPTVLNIKFHECACLINYERNVIKATIIYQTLLIANHSGDSPSSSKAKAKLKISRAWFSRIYYDIGWELYMDRNIIQ